jgi:hypothetical protein
MVQYPKMSEPITQLQDPHLQTKIPVCSNNFGNVEKAEPQRKTVIPVLGKSQEVIARSQVGLMVIAKVRYSPLLKARNK